MCCLHKWLVAHWQFIRKTTESELYRNNLYFTFQVIAIMYYSIAPDTFQRSKWPQMEHTHKKWENNFLHKHTSCPEPRPLKPFRFHSTNGEQKQKTDVIAIVLFLTAGRRKAVCLLCVSSWSTLQIDRIAINCANRIICHSKGKSSFCMVACDNSQTLYDMPWWWWECKITA